MKYLCYYYSTVIIKFQDFYENFIYNYENFVDISVNAFFQSPKIMGLLHEKVQQVHFILTKKQIEMRKYKKNRRKRAVK